MTVERSELQNLNAKLNSAIDVVDHLLDGGKYDPSKHPWLQKQIKNMFAERYVLAEPNAYVQKDEGAEATVTTQHPMRHTMRNKRNEFLRGLDEGYNGDEVHMSGSQVRARGDGKYEVEPSAKVYVLLKADMYALRDALNVMHEKTLLLLEGKNDDDLLRKPIIILSQTGRKGQDGKYYRPVLDHLKLSEEMTTALNITEVHRRDTAIKETRDALRSLRDMQVPPRARREPELKPGDTIFLHTTTLEKLRDYQAIFRERGVTVRMLSELEQVAESPEEKSHSYEGNAEEKLRAAQKLVAGIPDDFFDRKFKLKRSQVHVMVDDSGLSFKEPRLLDYEMRNGKPVAKYLDLTNMEGIIDNIQQWQETQTPFPGVELGPLTNACNGTVNLMQRIKEALDKIDAADPQHPADRSVVDVACMAISHAPDFDPRAKETLLKTYQPAKIMDHMMYADKDVEFTGDPVTLIGGKQINPKLLETKHFARPKDNNGERNTIAELEASDPQWRLRNHVRSHAARGLMSELGLPERSKSPELYSAYDEQRQTITEQPFKVITSGQVVEQVQQSLGNQSFTNVDAEHAPQKLSSLSDMEKVVAAADGFVLMPHKMQDLGDKYERAFRFWSLVVARQTDPRDAAKPIVVYNPNQEWDDLLDQYNILVNQSAIKEQPYFLMDVIDQNNGHGVHAITQSLQKARKERDLSVEYTNQGEEGSQRKNSSDRFQVAIFCSASSENESYKRAAFDLSYNLSKDGFGVVYGGGSRYMMGEIARGAQAAQDDGHTVEISGSNMDHLSLREGEAPPIVKPKFLRAKHIYQRMEFMIDSSDAFVIEPGGAGTLQELNALLMLKAKNDPSMQGKPIVLVNIKDEGGQGFYDAILEYMPKEDREALGLHVVDSVEKAKTLIDGWRENSQKFVKHGEMHGAAHEDRGFVDRYGQAATAHAPPQR